jgi:hypothetical protein
MLRRFVTLLCVATLSGLAGTVLGILIAPAPGSETRGRLSGFAEQHGDLVTDTVEQGRRLADAFAEFLTRRLSSPDDV